jgi:hypothetical protein
MSYYSQVMLKNSNKVMVTWIPITFSQVGRVLKLKRSDDTWEEGWVVTEIYSVKPEHDLDLLYVVLKDFKAVLGR